MIKSNFGKLIKLQLLGQFGINNLRYENDPKKKKRALIYIILMGIVAAYMSYYFYLTANFLCKFNLSSIIPSLAFVGASACVLLFAIFQAAGTLFSFKDYDTLTSLPIKTTDIVASKFFILYATNLVFTLIFMLPMGITDGVYNHAGATFYLIWISNNLVNTNNSSSICLSYRHIG